MARDFVVRDLVSALERRDTPAATTYNRLEGRPRSEDLSRSLRAEVRDGLWFLTRQWQLGEFTAEDAGSPVVARVHASTAPVTTYRPSQGTDQPYDGRVPLEALVEQRPLPTAQGAQLMSLDLRVAAGRRWTRSLRGTGVDPRGFLDAYPVRAPDPDAVADAGVCAHLPAWQFVAAVAGQAMDGWAFGDEARSDAAAALAAAGLTAAQVAVLTPTVERFVRWLDTWCLQPSEDAWQPAALDYSFSLDTAAPAAATITGDGYPGGHLDWHDVDLLEAPPDNPAPPQAPVRRSVLPTAAAFAGMPNVRWWAFEDGLTDFGAVRTDTTDLGRLLVIEFALAFGNDWFVVPLSLDGDALVAVEGLVVTNVFGERFWVPPAGTGNDDDWQRWAMFSLSRRGAGGAADTRVMVLPTAEHVQEGPLLEDIALVRDEMANLVWAIEGRVPLPHGRSVPGQEAAADTAAYHQRLASAAPVHDEPEPVAPLRYKAMSRVPEHWIPFVPVRTDGSSREVQLQRSAMPRLLVDGPQPPSPVRPRTSLLRVGLEAGQPYLVHEQEVPRSGVRVTQRFQRARWYDGRAVVWLAASKETGRGEASSGLAFDQAEHMRQGGS